MNVIAEDFETLRTNKEVCNAFLNEIQQHCKQRINLPLLLSYQLFSNLLYFIIDKLDKIEIPERVYLCKEVWTSDMGLLTDSLKLKRRPIEKYYAEVLPKLYSN